MLKKETEISAQMKELHVLHSPAARRTVELSLLESGRSQEVAQLVDEKFGWP